MAATAFAAVHAGGYMPALAYYALVPEQPKEPRKLIWLEMPNREFTPGSGNVFADLILPHADDLLAKAELAAKIMAEIKRRRLTQRQAAAVLGMDQPKISALKQGKLSGFSVARKSRA